MLRTFTSWLHLTSLDNTLSQWSWRSEQAGVGHWHCLCGRLHVSFAFLVCRFLRLPQYFSQNLGLQLRGFLLHGVHPCATPQDTQDCQETRGPSAGAWERWHPCQGRPPDAGYGALL